MPGRRPGIEPHDVLRTFCEGQCPPRDHPPSVRHRPRAARHPRAGHYPDRASHTDAVDDAMVEFIRGINPQQTQRLIGAARAATPRCQNKHSVPQPTRPQRRSAQPPVAPRGRAWTPTAARDRLPTGAFYPTTSRTRSGWTFRMRTADHVANGSTIDEAVPHPALGPDGGPSAEMAAPSTGNARTTRISRAVAAPRSASRRARRYFTRWAPPKPNGVTRATTRPGDGNLSSRRILHPPARPTRRRGRRVPPYRLNPTRCRRRVQRQVRSGQRCDAGRHVTSYRNSPSQRGAAAWPPTTRGTHPTATRRARGTMAASVRFGTDLHQRSDAKAVPSKDTGSGNPTKPNDDWSHPATRPATPTHGEPGRQRRKTTPGRRPRRDAVPSKARGKHQNQYPGRAVVVVTHASRETEGHQDRLGGPNPEREPTARPRRRKAHDTPRDRTPPHTRWRRSSRTLLGLARPLRLAARADPERRGTWDGSTRRLSSSRAAPVVKGRAKRACSPTKVQPSTSPTYWSTKAQRARPTSAVRSSATMSPSPPNGVK